MVGDVGTVLCVALTLVLGATAALLLPTVQEAQEAAQDVQATSHALDLCAQGWRPGCDPDGDGLTVHPETGLGCRPHAAVRGVVVCDLSAAVVPPGGSWGAVRW